LIPEDVVQNRDDPTQNEEIGNRVADQDSPQEVFGILQVFMQNPCGKAACPHPLTDSQTAEGEHSSFHPGKDK
jgi:hypothetical protein